MPQLLQEENTRFWLECRWLLLYLLLGQNGVIAHNKDLEQIKALVTMTDKGLFTQLKNVYTEKMFSKQ